MADQLELGKPAPVPVMSEGEKWGAREPDDFDLIAHQLFGVRPDARWLQVETLGDGKSPRHQTSFRLLMVVPPTVVYATGKRKGQINWKKRDKSLDRELVVSFAALDVFIERKRKAAQAELQAPGAGVTDRG